MLNTKKTQYMFVGSRKYVSEIPSGSSLKVGDNNITCGDSLKILGMHFDNHIAFEKHISEICRRT